MFGHTLSIKLSTWRWDQQDKITDIAYWWYYMEIYYWTFERFFKNALTRSIFELKTTFFFQMGQNFARNWLVSLSGGSSGTYMHSPASNFDKDPYEVKCHIRAQCGGGRGGLTFLPGRLNEKHLPCTCTQLFSQITSRNEPKNYDAIKLCIQFSSLTKEWSKNILKVLRGRPIFGPQKKFRNKKSHY